MEKIQRRAWSRDERKQYQNELVAFRQKPAPSNEQHVANVLLDLFPRVDKNRDGIVSGTEIDHSLHSDQFVAEQAAALVTMRSYLGELQNLQGRDSRLTRADLQILGHCPVGSSIAAAFLRNYQTYLELKSRPLRRLQDESFDPTGVRQGQLGSCVALATLMNLTPAQIRHLLKSNRDGSYTVRLADGSSHRVEEPSDCERSLHSQGKDGERWPALLEMALAQRLKELKTGGPITDLQPRAYLHQGAPAQTIFPLLLGYPGHVWEHRWQSPERARMILQESLRHGAVIACTEPDLTNGLVPQHAYKVSSFEADEVVLVNPWGQAPFSLNFLQFYASFADITSGLGQLPEHLRGEESPAEQEARRELELGA